jgi:hypothetical protein
MWSYKYPAGRGIKSHFGPEADLGQAVDAAQPLLATPDASVTVCRGRCR